ncbi:family 78 glycoside hydrolase catalytic domain [Amorphoplanes digitatis]|uniref:alpha-L-rhamnosidase n=1 Tax=Actinoplanes digitatis TaxID=1868 RepID=A0A7W7HW59_9ACTN|nr:family 78 glycoside hydrolase catalytic domain [Actinoplanes digitatis]MBB4761904.1 alpha-L-rhamnosidase [Actinoplanes digitatis]GID91016.1 alpha-L-rhamnosidase [Actinoplanes digitatis]
MTPYGLRVEHLDHPLGILTAAPRLSWRLPPGATGQRAYRIRTGNGWDTGPVVGSRSLLVGYEGPALRSAERVTWQVKVWTDRGESDWSAPGWFETGLLHAGDWRQDWIEPGAPLLRTAFTGRPTRLYLTAHGVYEAFVNGERVGDAELTPGFTQYRSRLQVQTYDIAALVRPGENVLAVVLSGGWWCGQTGALRATRQWGTRVAVLAQFDDGAIGPWRCARGHLTSADLIAGQRVDLTALPLGWTAPGFDDSGWDDAPVARHGYDTLVDSPAPPVRRVEEIVPVAITRPRPGRQVIDLGQNINGWIRLGRLGPAGTRITLTHGEHLDAGGELTTGHLRPAFPFLPAPLPAGMVDEVVSAGRAGEAFEPRHTTHGFRYVQVDGHPGELTPGDVRGVVVHTDLRRTGWFSCGDPRMHRLHEAALWGVRGNVCDIPTDCPQRERAGWTGDWQLFVPTAAFLYDVAGFSTKWLRDVAADQWADGTVANMSPCPPAEGPASPAAALHGSAGWGDAVVIVPWELYRQYADERILAEMWPAMVAWLDRAERMARTGRHPDRAAARPVPAPHEQYLWDTGFHWGEWLVPGEDPPPFDAMLTADHGDVATAYLARSAALMARIAAVLGRDGDARRYATLRERAVDAWRREFLDPRGRLTPDTQANLVRALAFDLVPEELRPAVADRLVELIRLAGTHLATGFLATPYLLPVLADAGHCDVAFELLLRDTEPSWLTMLDRGATTMWEHWNGVDADGVAHHSLNHYAKGAVVSFLHRYVAGLVPVDPAYRRFRVRPHPGGGITWAEAVHESPYGRIKVRWELDSEFVLHVTVPPGCTAEAILPDGTTLSLGPGSHTRTARPR